VTIRVPDALPRYRRELPYGWVLGAFPVEELLRHAPGAALEVRWHGALPEERRARLQAACDRAGVPARRDDATVAAKRSKGTARALAVFAKPRPELRLDRPHLALVAPRDPGNLGATLRTALAFGVEDVAVTGGGVDPWSPHVLRASLGAAFALRIAQPASLEAYRDAWPDRPLWLLDASGDADVEALAAGSWPSTLAAGPEWPGLTERQRALGRTVRIAHDPRVESLNVTVAVGIALRCLRAAAPDAGGARSAV
jgi:TrmH family RNA methyltransferase